MGIESLNYQMQTDGLLTWAVHGNGEPCTEQQSPMA